MAESRAKAELQFESSAYRHPNSTKGINTRSSSESELMAVAIATQV